MNTLESPNATSRMLLKRGLDSLIARRRWLVDYGDYKAVESIDRQISLLKNQLEAIDV